MELLEREPLLASLRRFHAEAARGAGTLACVSGEAGMGKSAAVGAFLTEVPGTTAVHRGWCDALTTPRPLGPLRDIARARPGEPSRLLADGADRHALFTAFLDLIAAGPSVTVVEDVHWADAATADLLLFVGRRIGDLPALVVVTYRADEIGAGHPLRRVLGDLATAPSVRRLGVPPLTEAAVRALAEPTGRDSARLHAVTGGNPFFVTEALAAPEHELPATVRDAVLARANRLGPGARAVLDGVALVPDGVDGALLEAVTAVDAEGLDEGVRSGILVLDGPVVRFRHELARRAVEADIPAAHAAALHDRILRLLAGLEDVDPARLAFHADAAGDAEAVLRYAPSAGGTAVGLGAYREAAALFAMALRHSGGAPAELRAQLWERRADACHRSGDADAALDASVRSAELWRTVGDVDREAAVLSRRSTVQCDAGRTVEARESADTAVAMLADRPPGPELARAYAAQARVHVLDGRPAAAIAAGSAALPLAERFDDPATLGWALNAVGNAHWATDPDRAVELLTSGLETARRIGDDLGAAVALNDLGAGAVEIRRYDEARRWLDRAVEWSTERDLDASRSSAQAWRARRSVERGRWGEATAAAAHVVAEQPEHAPSHVVALTVLGRLRVRRGDPDAVAPLDRAWALAEPAGDLRRTWPVAAGRAEAAWLSGEPDRVEALVGDTYRCAVAQDHPWAAGELAHWLVTAGGDVEPPAGLARPWALQIAGEAGAAAAAWRELGCPYEAALALAGSPDPDDLLAALHEMQRLGAWPVADAVAGRLRDRGVRGVPGRPRRATRDNPAQLTERQVEVLGLLSEGLRNVDIAARLHITPKTVDHHVSAILTKLGVGSRAEAARWASARWESARSGPEDGEVPAVRWGARPDLR